ncbi:MAG: right-handed parallel beta-helix repeat-containing protein [Candidatus Hodarchaeales archaeon]|jgi:parallel beta-helix repeat protein
MYKGKNKIIIIIFITCLILSNLPIYFISWKEASLEQQNELEEKNNTFSTNNYIFNSKNPLEEEDKLLISINDKLLISINNQNDLQNNLKDLKSNEKKKEPLKNNQYTHHAKIQGLQDYIDHSPIFIDGNGNFTDTAIVNSWSGNGTAGNPYIIDNYNITGTGNIIEIRNTNLYFQITNSILSDGTNCIYLANVTNGELVNNTVYGNSNSGFNLILSSNNTLINNSVYNNYIGIELNSGTNNSVIGNIIYLNTENGIRLRSSTNYNNLKGNFIFDNKYGIAIPASVAIAEHNSITNNMIYNNTQHGVSFESGGNFNTFFNNTVFSNGISGISFAWSSNNSVWDNYIFNNSQQGMIICYSSNYNNINSNIILNNNQYGFYIHTNALYNSFLKNIISDNSLYGIYLSSNSHYNHFKWNNLVKNNAGLTSQAYDDSSGTIFEYNYWDDWTSPDNDGNDVVDFPYPINGTSSNSDLYPLRYPSSMGIPSDPIYINGNSGFVTLGFPGSGTFGDPFILEDFYIRNSTNTNLIHIQNTNAYFKIRNIILNGLNGANNGIYLNNVTNGIIENNTVYNNTNIGVYLISSSYNNFLINNTVFDNANYGISLQSSDNNSVINNTAFHNNLIGIYLNSASNNSLFNNTVYNIQFGLDTTGINIDSTSNYNNITYNIVYNHGRGIWISFNCEYNRITDNYAYNNTYHGIYIWQNSPNNFLINNTVYNNVNHGIYLYTIVNTTITNNIVYNNSQHGIYLYASSNNNTLSNNIIFSNNIRGIHIYTSCNFNSLINNSVYNNNYGLYIYASSTQNFVFNNSFYDNNIGIYVHLDSNNNDLINNSIYNNQDGITFESSHNNTISYNRVFNNTNKAIILSQSCNYNYFSFNIIYNNQKGFYLYHNSDFNSIFNNTIYSNQGAIFAQSSVNNSIFNNFIYLISNVGIELVGCHNSSLTNNYIFNTNIGIYLTQSMNNTVSSNIVFDNIASGIRLYQSNNIIISGNTAYNNSYGIRCRESHNSTLLDNVLNINSYYGIDLLQSNYNAISDNEISNNVQHGIYFSSSLYNSVKRNLLIGNNAGNNQAYDNGANNIFNFNYWNNWITPDSNGDGIVDIPYLIDGSAGNNDPSPLVNPLKFHHPFYITSNTDFTFLNFSGDGTLSNPYLIENYFIINSTSNYLIFIENTDVYFVIQFNLLFSLKGSQYGIFLQNVSNGKIETNNINTNTENGISLIDSSNILISNNVVYNNKIGIQLSSSDNNILINNDLFNNEFGLTVNSANYNTFSYNNIFNNTQHGTTHSASNFSNFTGNYFYYNDINGFSLATSSNNLLINNIAYNNTDEGFYLGSSSFFNVIINNSAFNNLNSGFAIRSSSNSTFINNSAYDNIFGFYIYDSSNNNFFTNNILFDNDLGFFLYTPSNNNNTFTNNVVYNNNYGFNIDSSNNTKILNNSVYNNYNMGFILANSVNTTILYNIIVDNLNYGIYLDSSCSNSHIEKNSFIDNRLSGNSQGYDSGFNNTFTHNYWSEWTSPDINGDYIVDEPYNIDGGVNQDLIPLVVEFDNLFPYIASPVDFSIYKGYLGYSILWAVTSYPPANYSVYRNNTLIVNNTLNGTIIIWLENLNVGIYNFTCIIIDGFGNSAMDEVWVTIIPLTPDTTPPVISSPSDITIEEGSIGYSITWIGSDNNPWRASIWKNGSLFYDESWIGNEIKISLDGLVAGIYEFNCTLIDEAGNTRSDIVIVTVFEPVPDIDSPIIHAPSSLEYNEGSEGNYLIWNCTDNHPYAYQILINKTELIFGPWHGENITINIDGLEVGIWIINLTIWDISGNMASNTVIVTVLPVAPDITPPILNQPVDLLITENMSATIVWEVSDDHPAEYLIYQNNSQIIQPVSWISGLIQYSFESLPLGAWEFNLTIWDQAGNRASSIAIVRVLPKSVFDMEPPQISTILDKTIVYGTTNNLLHFYLFDQHPQGYFIYINGTKIVENAWINPNIQINYSLDGLRIGFYLINLTALDIFGNSASETIIITVIGEDFTPPTISSPPDKIIIEGLNEIITWIVYDENPQTYEIILLPEGNVIESGSWNGEDIEYDLSTLIEGVYTIRCKVYDSTGNNGFDDVVVNIEPSESTDEAGPGFEYPFVLIIISIIMILRYSFGDKRRFIK